VLVIYYKYINHLNK